MDWTLLLGIAGTFATVINGWIVILVMRILRKQDEQDARFLTIESFIRNELRLFDVRLSVLETMIKR